MYSVSKVEVQALIFTNLTMQQKVEQDLSKALVYLFKSLLALHSLLTPSTQTLAYLGAQQHRIFTWYLPMPSQG